MLFVAGVGKLLIIALFKIKFKRIRDYLGSKTGLTLKAFLQCLQHILAANENN